MNLDKESKSYFFFFFFLGGGGRGGEGGGFQPEKKTQKTIGIRLFFVLMLYIKFHVPGSSGSLVLHKQKEERTGKGHSSANVLRNLVKSHLNMDPKQYSEFQSPNSRNYLHVVLTRFFYCNKS